MSGYGERMLDDRDVLGSTWPVAATCSNAAAHNFLRSWKIVMVGAPEGGG